MARKPNRAKSRRRFGTRQGLSRLLCNRPLDKAPGCALVAHSPNRP